jgi:hypothetical protein
LLESEALLASIFELMGTSVAVYEAVENGKDFILTALNIAAEKILCVSRENALGQRLLELFPYMKIK